MTSIYSFFVKWGEITPEFTIGDYIIKQVNNNDDLEKVYDEESHQHDIDKDSYTNKEYIIFTVFDDQFKQVGVISMHKKLSLWIVCWSQTIWMGDDYIDEITDATEMPFKDDYRRLNHEVENVFFEIERLMNL